MVLLSKAWAQRGLGAYDLAKSLTDKALDLCSENDHDFLGRIYHHYMQFASDHDRLDEAITMSMESVGHYERAADSERVAHAKRHLADLYRRAGFLDEAKTLMQEALAYFKSTTKNSLDYVNALRVHALVLEESQEHTEALACWQDVRDLYESLGIEEGVFEAKERIRILSGVKS